MDFCTFVDGNERRNAIILDMDAQGKGRVHWEPALVDAFGTSLLELDPEGHPPIDSNGYTPQLFLKGHTYQVKSRTVDRGTADYLLVALVAIPAKLSSVLLHPLPCSI